MNKKKLPSLISILILTLITVVMWISFEIYRAISKSPSSVVPTEVSQVLTPTLDQDIMKKVEARLFIDDSQIPENIISSSTPTTKPVATPQSTASSDISTEVSIATTAGTTQ